MIKTKVEKMFADELRSLKKGDEVTITIGKYGIAIFMGAHHQQYIRLKDLKLGVPYIEIVEWSYQIKDNTFCFTLLEPISTGIINNMATSIESIHIISTAK